MSFLKWYLVPLESYNKRLHKLKTYKFGRMGAVEVISVIAITIKRVHLKNVFLQLVCHLKLVRFTTTFL